LQKQNQTPASEKTKSNLLVTESVPGKMEIEFLSKNGVTQNKVKMYQNIDLLANETQEKNYANVNY